MVVTLGLKGQSWFIDSGGGELVFKQGYTSITTFTSVAGERQYEADKSTFQLRFSLTKKGLANLFGEDRSAALCGRERMLQISCRPISPQGRLAAQQLAATD